MEELKPVDPSHARAFLDGLTELTMRYGIEIQACGCCQGPSLWTIEPSGSKRYVADEDKEAWWLVRYVVPEDED